MDMENEGLEANTRFKFHDRPRIKLGPYEIVPYHTPDTNRVIQDKWVLPGCKVVSIRDVYKIAALNGWVIEYL